MPAPSQPPAVEPAAASQPAEAEPRGSFEVLVHYLLGLACRMGVLFGLYVLSIGPMYWRWYSGKFGNGSEYVAAFYEPLWVLCIQFPMLGEWVDGYVWLWNMWGR
jgi:hypothetical protein